MNPLYNPKIGNRKNKKMDVCVCVCFFKTFRLSLFLHVSSVDDF